MAERLYAGLTSQTIDIFLPDSSSTTGAGLAGLVFNSAGLTCYYRKGATGTSTAITLATQTVAGAWSSGGFVEIDATNMKGLYRFDIPNAVIDTAGFAHIVFRGATNLAPTIIRIDCRAVVADAKFLGGTSQTGRDIGASVLLSSGTGTGQLSLSSGLVTLAGVTHTGAVIPTVTTLTGHTAQTGDTYALANGATGFTAIDTVVDAIKVKTDFLPSATAGAAGGGR